MMRKAGCWNSCRKKGGLDFKNVTYTICQGSPNAEIEDCYNKNEYIEAILNEYGVNLNVTEFRNNKKWSERIKNCFYSQGKIWNDDVEKRVKLTVAQVLSNNPDNALNVHKRSCLDSLVTSILALLS